jgi:uncharacterized protein YqgQ
MRFKNIIAGISLAGISIEMMPLQELEKYLDYKLLKKHTFLATRRLVSVP